MKHLLVYLFYCFLGTLSISAFAKISEPSRAISITEMVTTQATEKEIYRRLDAFIEHPSPENATIFKQWLDERQASSKQAQLALVIARSNLGFFEERFGRLQNAISEYNTAWLSYQKHELSGFDILESCLKPLGVLYTKTNALTEAQTILEQYILLIKKENQPKALAGGITNLSVVYHNQGKFTQAIYLLRDGLKMSPDNPDLLTNLASNYIGNSEFQKAIETAQKSLAIHPNQPNAHKIIARVYANEQLYDKAITSLQTGVEQLRKDKNVTARDIAKTQLAIAEIIFKKVEAFPSDIAYVQTQDLLNDVYKTLLPRNTEDNYYPKKSDLFPENTLIDALDLQAALKYAQGQPMEALHFYELAYSATELLSSTIVSQQSQLIIQSSAKRRGEKYIAIAHELYQQHQEQDLIGKTLAVIERSKATVVSKAFANKVRLQSSKDTTLIQKIQYREQRLAKTLLAMQKIRIHQNTDSKSYERLLDSIGVHRFKLNELRSLFNTTHTDGVFDLDHRTKSIQKIALEREETVVQYFLGSEHSYQLVISGNEQTFKQLTANAEEQKHFLNAIRSFIRFFETPSAINDAPLDFGKTAFGLYKQLQLPTSSNLVIIPDGIMQYLPFDALFINAFEGFNYQEMPFLFKNTAISYVLSTSLYVLPKSNTRISNNDSILGVLPVFENSALALNYSLDEGKAIQDSFRNHELLFRADATEAAAFAKAETYDILHFSTHASGGSFSNPATLQFIDQQTPVHRLYGAQLHPKLIVLSACETGVGTLAYGEGAQSLARGFQYAGARNILFSLWKVNDKSTSQLMSSYYRLLSKTHSRDQSMRLAKLEYLDNPEISNTKKSPYYWSSFVYYGQKDTIDSWAKRNGIILIILGLVLISGFYLIRKYGFSS